MSLFLVAFLLAAEPVAVAPPVEPATVEKPRKPKKICRKQAADTGSHMAKTLCLTQEQWDTRNASLSADEFDATHGSVGH